MSGVGTFQEETSRRCGNIPIAIGLRPGLSGLTWELGRKP